MKNRILGILASGFCQVQDLNYAPAVMDCLQVKEKLPLKETRAISAGLCDCEASEGSKVDCVWFLEDTVRTQDTMGRIFSQREPDGIFTGNSNEECGCSAPFQSDSRRTKLLLASIRYENGSGVWTISTDKLRLFKRDGLHMSEVETLRR